MFIVMEYPWVSVSGYGAHIKSTHKKLVIQKKNKVEEYPLDSVKNLLIVGGHTISSTSIAQLIKNGVFISFFESDGSLVGTLKPFTDDNSEHLNELQKGIPRHRYAISLAQGSIKSRLFAIHQAELRQSSGLFYEGELEIIQNSLDEMTYLIKVDEIRRLHRLTSDMYYEIMSRNLPPDLGFRRRTIRPQTDPVNAMLSFGYAMLFGNCCVSVIGSRLNPDIGFIHDGKGSLVYDLIDPLKADMVDSIVFKIARESLKSWDFECTPDRCMLSEELIKKMMGSFYTTINHEKIYSQVIGLLNSIRSNDEFKVLY